MQGFFQTLMVLFPVSIFGITIIWKALKWILC